MNDGMIRMPNAEGVGKCVADLDADGNPLRSYLWGQGIDNLLAVTVYAGNGGTTSVSSVYYAIKDHLGSVHALVDESGNAALTVRYDAWGTPQVSSFIPHPSSFPFRYLFQGREYSFATGLYNFRARWYEPRLGRWLSNDPIGISGGLNLYAFCGNDPVNYVDPWGLADLNLVPPGDKERKWADLVKTGDGSFGVVGHGTPGVVLNENKKPMSSRKLAERILESQNYTPGQTVALGTCYAGDGCWNSAASKLSGELARQSGKDTTVTGYDKRTILKDDGSFHGEPGGKWYSYRGIAPKNEK